uniref:Uncharacterized protein n=1 Tax=Oryza sativa subsp. japonica TaxID=39947 RepID=Q69TX9_ORYSJ|nr:hypothetical protein [Oryza sativa Japonica Group]
MPTRWTLSSLALLRRHEKVGPPGDGTSSHVSYKGRGGEYPRNTPASTTLHELQLGSGHRGVRRRRGGQGGSGDNGDRGGAVAATANVGNLEC